MPPARDEQRADGETRISASSLCLEPVAKAGQLDELVEAPGVLVRDASGELPGYLVESHAGPADSAGHGCGRVHVPADGDRGADGLPVILGAPQERVQAP